MSDALELDEDLEHWKTRHSIDSNFAHDLKKSPQSAQKYIQSYKVITYIVCPIFMLFGLILIVLAFVLLTPKLGIVSGMAGAVMLHYFANDFLKSQKAVREIESIATYHGLL